ncbi:MAG: TolC family protein [Rubritalea sp.]|tara:strand:- start:230 stop:1555 length:1326 start_codon:yes stop_codon:yes gene_type:complete
MFSRPTIILLSCVTLAVVTGCGSIQKSTPNPTLIKPIQSTWWQQFNDDALNKDIAIALTANPDLQAVATRIAQADAAISSANASLLPRVNLGLGFLVGRKREPDLGPYTLAPWRSGASLSWEMDLSGKLRAARKSAVANKEASVWDYHAARLELTSRIAAVRFNIYRFNTEIASFHESLAGSKRILILRQEQLGAGLVAEALVNKQQIEHTRLERQKLDVIRLRDLSIVQLNTLRGGSPTSNTLQDSFPSIRSIASKPISQLLASHPSLLAEEARVRAAFQLERSARLNLLPSFALGAGINGGQTSLVNRYRVWAAQVGPSLDIPIYDPARRAALKTRQAQRMEASENYKSVVLKILAEVESAHINLNSRSSQMAALKIERLAITRSLNHSREEFQAGLISQTNYLDTEHQWLESIRSEAALRQAELNASINLIKALGGGM